jgi:FkbM family methyltransferase
MSGLTPRVATTEPAHAHLLGSVVEEVRGLHKGFGNWPGLCGAIAVGRVRGRPPALTMRVRHGPTLATPGGDRSWRTAVEIFGRDCYQLARAGLPPAPVVVDIGANIGGFSLAVLNLRPRAQIAAFEASPAALVALQRNVAANGVGERVAVHHAAVTGPTEPGTVWLNEHVGDLCTSSVLESSDAGRESTHRVKVPARPLSAILASYPHGVDLLKMDVEGAEYDIVAATSPQLFARVQRVVVEYHDVPGHNVDELAAHLHEAGLLFERHEHSALPNQGLAWWAQADGNR